MHIKSISQNNFFHSYNKKSNSDQLIKNKTYNYGQDLKQIISYGDNRIIAKLNNIATRIQKRINRATVTNNDLIRYKSELQLLFKHNFEIHDTNIDNFFKCCILLSKHDTQETTKLNYFFLTNKTKNLKYLSESNKKFSNIDSITIDELDLLLINIFSDQHNSHQATEVITSYSDNKFKFTYSNPNLSIENKMVEEDKFALNTLLSINSKNSVKEISHKLSLFLEHDINISQQLTFYNQVLTNLGDRKGEYPIPKIDITSFNHLLTLLKENEDHILLLSLIWIIILGNNLSGLHIDNIDIIYRKDIKPSKDYTISEEDYIKNKTLNNGRFGNSKSISSDIFSENKFHPFVRSIDYIKINNQSYNLKVQKFINKNIPYISGFSGMANMTCKILSKLHIHPYSKIGKQFLEAMSAFIVGSGMHSYYEVYKSFNLYAKKIHYMSNTKC